MAIATIPVDLFNPGQVFACLGLVEAVETFIGPCRAAFDWRKSMYPVFRLGVDGECDPVAAALQHLATAEVKALIPPGSSHRTDKWKVPMAIAGNDLYPIPEPDGPPKLPALLCAAGKTLLVDHWGDGPGSTGRDGVKFWAGSGGYPGCALLRDALELVRDRLGAAADDPFALSAPQSSSFRFDWRRDYIPIDAGFSPNEHPEVTMVGYPAVEILAAIGLSNARPQAEERNKLAYRYGVVASPGDTLLDPIFLRVGLGASRLPFPQRIFRMSLGWPGQEGQARSITEVIEEAGP